MVQTRKSYPDDPDAMVPVRVYVQSKYRQLYDTDELRGKMSKDFRITLAARGQHNGYGFEGLQVRWEAKREALVHAQMEFNVVDQERDAYFASAISVQKDLTRDEKASEMQEEVLRLVQERFATWQKKQPDDPKRRATRQMALTWCEAELKRSDVLCAQFPKAENLLRHLEPR